MTRTTGVVKSMTWSAHRRLWAFARLLESGKPGIAHTGSASDSERHRSQRARVGAARSSGVICDRFLTCASATLTQHSFASESPHASYGRFKGYRGSHGCPRVRMFSLKQHVAYWHVTALNQTVRLGGTIVSFGEIIFALHS